MDREEYINDRLLRSNNDLVKELITLRDEVTKRDYEIVKLRKLLNIKESDIMSMDRKLQETKNIGEYYKTKKRPYRRKDISDEYLYTMYVVEKKSVYKISKETGWADMTIRHRLKLLGLYEGKYRYMNKGEL